MCDIITIYETVQYLSYCSPFFHENTFHNTQGYSLVITDPMLYNSWLNCATYLMGFISVGLDPKLCFLVFVCVVHSNKGSQSVVVFRRTVAKFSLWNCNREKCSYYVISNQFHPSAIKFAVSHFSSECAYAWIRVSVEDSTLSRQVRFLFPNFA